MNNGPRVVISLELSNAMTEYLDGFKAAAAKFILHDVPNGARIGVTSFSTSGKEEVPLTTISDEEDSRQDIVEAIEGLSTAPLEADCVGAGLSESLKVNKDCNGSGSSHTANTYASSLFQTLGDSGIIMLFTAGSENQCTSEGELEPVASSTVRLMNVAFGNESDSELDELASQTNGITYTVETSGK